MFKILIFNRSIAIIPKNGVITCRLNILYNICNSLPVETFSSFICLLIRGMSSPEKKRDEKNWDEDAKLVRQFKQGDRGAYIHLFNKYNEEIYRYCYMLLSKRREPAEDATDAMEEAFTRCFTKIYSLRRESYYFLYLRKTAYGICMDILKEPQPPSPPETEETEYPDQTEEVPDFAPNPEEDIIKTETQTIVRKALNALGNEFGDKYRLAVINVHLMGYSYQEAAEIMGCKVSDIRNWVRRGLLKLRDILKEYKDLIK